MFLVFVLSPTNEYLGDTATSGVPDVWEGGVAAFSSVTRHSSRAMLRLRSASGRGAHRDGIGKGAKERGERQGEKPTDQ
jgi:hypothetical protein